VLLLLHYNSERCFHSSSVKSTRGGSSLAPLSQDSLSFFLRSLSLS